MVGCVRYQQSVYLQDLCSLTHPTTDFWCDTCVSPNVIEARGGGNLLSKDVQKKILMKFEEKLQETGEIEFNLLRILLESLGLKVGLMVI